MHAHTILASARAETGYTLPGDGPSGNTSPDHTHTAADRRAIDQISILQEDS